MLGKDEAYLYLGWLKFHNHIFIVDTAGEAILGTGINRTVAIFSILFVIDCIMEHDIK